MYHFDSFLLLLFLFVLLLLSLTFIIDEFLLFYLFEITVWALLDLKVWFLLDNRLILIVGIIINFMFWFLLVGIFPRVNFLLHAVENCLFVFRCFIGHLIVLFFVRFTQVGELVFQFFNLLNAFQTPVVLEWIRFLPFLPGQRNLLLLRINFLW